MSVMDHSPDDGCLGRKSSEVLAQLPRGTSDTDSTQVSLWRTRRLFDLAVMASGEVPSRIARSLGIDLRSVEGLRETPTLGYVARIASMLGIDAASAIRLVGTSASSPIQAVESSSDTIECAHTRDPLLGAIAAADLDDDALELEHLAAVIAADPERAQQFSVAMLLSARAASAQGDVEEARRRLDFALGFRCEIAALGLLRELDRCVRLEAALGCPWERLPLNWCAEFASIPSEIPVARIETLPASVSRMQACACVRALFREIARPSGDVAECFAALAGTAEAAARAGCARSIAWCASIAGIASLRALETERLTKRCERTAMELLVRCQFMLDDALASNAPNAQAALRRRRQRLALHEWCDRAWRGEMRGAFVDELDIWEVRTMFVRFPGARKSVLAEMFKMESRQEIL
jgi:hypothetical protein